MTNSRVLALLGIAALVMASGCAGARRREPIANPLRASTPAVSHGEMLFDQNCYKCHPGGEGGLAPAIADKPFPDLLKRFQIRHGLGSMPAFSKE